MNKKKTIIAAIVLLLVLLIGGAIAYFTDKTETITNTFTVGNVDITLTEPNWVADNAKNIVPGAVVAKDPTVTVASTSADAWVFVKVEVPCVGTTPRELFAYTVEAGWTTLSDGTCAEGKATKIYGHTASMTKNATAVLFTTVTLDANLTSEEAGTLTTIEMPVTAYAIQKDNVAGATLEVFNTYFSS